MIGIEIRDTIKDVIADINVLERDISDKAAIRAVNRTGDAVRTAAGRELRKIYNLRQRAITRATRVKRANRNSRVIQAQVIFSGRPIPLIEFGARAVNPYNVAGRPHRRGGGGVSVQIKLANGRRVRQGAFITTTSRGVHGVFERVGAGRYPIKQLRSISIPTAVTTRAINSALVELASTRFRSEFAHQLKYLLSKR